MERLVGDVMKIREARHALAGDIMLWREIRDGFEPLVQKNKLGRLCGLFKAGGCTGCPMVVAGQACGRSNSTWKAYYSMVMMCQRRSMMKEIQDHFSNGVFKLETEKVLYSIVAQLVFDLEAALEAWD